MQQVRLLSNRPLGHEDEATDFELDSSVCDEVADLIVAVRAALARGERDELRRMAHPMALRHERARLGKRFGTADAASFWSHVTAEVEAVRLVAEGVAEVYEHVRHHRSGTSLRLVSTVEYVKGRWRMTEARDASDERITAVLLRGAPPDQPLDAKAWTARWEREHGPTAVLHVNGGRGAIDHPTEGWSALLRTGSGRDLARGLALRGPAAELLEKQPAATVLSLVPMLEARKRTNQLRWISHARSPRSAPGTPPACGSPRPPRRCPSRPGSTPWRAPWSSPPCRRSGCARSASAAPGSPAG